MKYKLILWALVLAAFMALYFWSTGQHTKGYEAGYAKRSEETLEAVKNWEHIQAVKAGFIKKTTENLRKDYAKKGKDFDKQLGVAEQELQNLLFTVDLQRAQLVRLNKERIAADTKQQANVASPTGTDDRTGLENVVRECASVAVEMAEDAEKLRNQVIGLQQFANLAEASCQ